MVATTIEETVTLSQAKTLISSGAHEQSFLLLSPPGIGKSELVRQAAAEAGLPCRSLLGTQIAPEDVSGVPRIVGERSVFCPPRILLPEDGQPFCLFLDELPASSPDIQKAFYSLLLERRIGEHRLPAGTWVVAAGNRAEDRALVRSISSALVNRVVLLQVRHDVTEWLAWAETANVRVEVRHFIQACPDALLRPTPSDSIPYSTPRAWVSLSRTLELASQAGVLDDESLLALIAGRVSAKDAFAFYDWFRAVQRVPETLDLGYTKLMNTEVDMLDLSSVAVHTLKAHGVYNVGQLIAKTRSDLRDMKEKHGACFGAMMDRARVDEISMALQRKGLKLRTDNQAAAPTITLDQAKSLIQAVGHRESLLLLSSPGIGKSSAIMQAADEQQMTCRSLLGTQIAPEDVSGIPTIQGDRSVFCPPRVLLPENPTPFYLFLDELPACTPDVQKAFYALLLERRVGEHSLPEGCVVVAAGNRSQDRALVRPLSTALVNRVFVLNIRVDHSQWLAWAKTNNIRSEILAFLTYMPGSLLRCAPAEPRPFSTPRAWSSLSRSLDLAEAKCTLDSSIRRALAFGTLSPEDASLFCAMAEESLAELLPLEQYLDDPDV
ncbi:MAG: AAA family ATPase, partial [Planctomycetales bacterium]|nr:AAA family ATPase [Planctomycetales bacterium]